MLLSGKIIKIFKQTDDWICFKFEDKESKKSYTAKGNVSGLFMPGIEVNISGKFVDDKTYGRQIEVTDINMKNSIAATFLYKCVKGVGLSLAEEIVKTYGEDCIDKILKDNTILLNVKGIKEKKYKMITESINKNNNIGLYMAILDFFNGDVTQNQADKIVDVCNKKITSFKKIKKNPYWLITHVEGFGFKKVDKLALASGLKEFSVERIGAAIVFALQENSQRGHCYSDMETLSSEIAELILGYPDCITSRSKKAFWSTIDTEDNEKFEEFCKKYKNEEELRDWREKYYNLLDVICEALIEDIKEGLIVEENERIYWIDLYKAEVSAARIIREMSWEVPIKRINRSQINNAIKEIEEYEGCEFSEEQKDAVIKSIENRISIITGGPGRGKTTIIKAIIRAWNDDESVVLLAPTGRAAKRMTEASGYKASTIQRYKNRTFGENTDGKLYIIDETSMIGIMLGNTVLKMGRHSNIIFVGDIDQLASIEPGTFMKDMIESGIVPVSRLTKGFRSDGSIARNADLFNKGKHLKSFILDSDTIFMEKMPENIVPTIVDVYVKLLDSYKMKEIGILSPLRRNGYGCVNGLNEAIRNRINPETEENKKNGSGFLVNDRVMHLKNNYEKEIINEYSEEEYGIFNGDTGTITNIDYELEQVEIYFDDEKRGYFTYGEMKNCFELAFTTTIHKSQGSEYKAVILVVSSQHSYFLKRNLIYTGITRAKSHLLIVGNEKAIAVAARNIDDSSRNSRLCMRIQEKTK